jgi:putative two-component system response regulator
MCLHHHERYDGKGYPDKLRGGEISFYTQLCGMAEHFDELFYKRSEYNERQFEFVCKEMDVGGQPYGPEVLALLESCEQLIVASYKKMED